MVTRRARTVLDSLEPTKLGLRYARQDSVAHIESGCNKDVYQLFSGCLWEEGTNAANVPKVEVGGWAHTADQSGHGHAGVLNDA